MSELFDKEVNAQKGSSIKTCKAHISSRKPMKKCAMKMKQRKMMRIVIGDILVYAILGDINPNDNHYREF